MKAARALLSIDQRQLAQMSDLSLPTIQRMEACPDRVRGTVESLMRVIEALNQAGIELIGEGADSQGRGRGVRLRVESAGVVPAVSDRSRLGEPISSKPD